MDFRRTGTTEEGIGILGERPGTYGTHRLEFEGVGLHFGWGAGKTRKPNKWDILGNFEILIFQAELKLIIRVLEGWGCSEINQGFRKGFKLLL